mgnify:CR=1 FL=1
MHRLLALLVAISLFGTACDNGATPQQRPVVYEDISSYIIEIEHAEGQTTQGIIIPYQHPEMGMRHFLIVDADAFDEAPEEATLSAPQAGPPEEEQGPVTVSLAAAKRPDLVMAMGMMRGVSPEVMPRPLWVCPLPAEAEILPSLDLVALAQRQLSGTAEQQLESLFVIESEEIDVPLLQTITLAPASYQPGS